MVSAYLPRLVFFCALLAALAVVAPKLAPSLMASFFAGSASDATVSEPQSAAVERPDRDLAPSPAPRVSAGREYTVRADDRGHYLVSASINGRSASAMIDTGATAVALTEETAGKLGLRPPQSAYKIPISTANGVIGAAEVTLREIRVGNVSVYNVPAIVVPAGALDVNLLGMTFLGRLARFESSRGQLVLVQ